MVSISDAGTEGRWLITVSRFEVRDCGHYEVVAENPLGTATESWTMGIKSQTVSQIAATEKDFSVEVHITHKDQSQVRCRPERLMRSDQI